MENKGKIKNKKSSSKNINKKYGLIIFIVLAIVVLYGIISIIKLIKNPTDTFMVENGKLSQEETTTGYIIRDEIVVKGQNYKNGMEQIKTEGEKVGKDEAIFRYYSTGEDDLLKKIQDLDTKIQETMTTEEGIFSNDIKMIESQIETKINELYKENDLEKITEGKRQISSYITKKAKIAGELSPSGSYLKKLIDERSGYENELNAGSEYVTAPKSGLISYRVDGLETTLTPNEFGKISKEFLEGLNLKTGQMVASSNESGKIIDNYKCYIACILKSEEAKKTKVSDKVTLRLPSSKEITAKIEYLAQENEDETILIFSVTNSINELSSYRKISFDVIWWDTEGYKIPNSAIKEEDNLSYVVRNRAGYLDKILIKVTKQTEKYSIVTNYTSKELKQLKEENGEIKAKTTIQLYDEILINPTDEQMRTSIVE